MHYLIKLITVTSMVKTYKYLHYWLYIQRSIIVTLDLWCYRTIDNISTFFYSACDDFLNAGGGG